MFIKPNALNAEIEAAQRQLVTRQHRLQSRRMALMHTLKQQLLAPTTLLWAVGGGFILGELTRCHRGGTQYTETRPLAVAIKLLASARTLYAALTLAWLLQSRYIALLARPPPVP